MLVAGVGYQHLRDLSAGLHVLERLDGLDARVDREDLSYGPIDVLFLLQRRPRYAAGVFVTGTKRGRTPGAVEERRWDFPTLSADALQERIGEALSGVISLDNLLHICGHFGALPEEVTVIEVEPADDGWGEGLSDLGAQAVATAARLARDAAMRPLSR